MPADHLKAERAHASHRPLPPPAPSALKEVVESILAGVPLTRAAERANMNENLLGQAVEVYRAAGAAALATRADDTWYHANVQFTDWRTAEPSAVAELAPRLRRLASNGTITGWWFLRKYPCWRLRLHPSPGRDHRRVRADVEAALDDLTATAAVERWWPATYEPETFAFGGPQGITIAHNHFCDDSLAVADYLGQDNPGLGRREMSVLLCNLMFSAAGLDWFEIGDVWDKVAHLRTATPGRSPAGHQRLVDQLRALSAAHTGPASPLFAAASPVAFAAPWANAFDRAGRDLHASATAGTLQRGIRHILSHLVIFHWNRLGLDAEAQSALCLAARDATLPRS